MFLTPFAGLWMVGDEVDESMTGNRKDSYAISYWIIHNRRRLLLHPKSAPQE